MPLEISETWVNATKGHGIGESGWYEPFTDDRGKLYRSLMREYGRCIGKVYVDVRTPAAEDDGTMGAYKERAKPIGWVFQGRDKYSDTGEPYVRETWVTVREKGEEL
jgi:hypothetical protein